MRRASLDEPGRRYLLQRELDGVQGQTGGQRLTANQGEGGEYGHTDKELQSFTVVEPE